MLTPVQALPYEKMAVEQGLSIQAFAKYMLPRYQAEAGYYAELMEQYQPGTSEHASYQFHYKDHCRIIRDMREILSLTVSDGTVISVLVVDAIDACLEDSILRYGSILPGNHGKQIVILPVQYVFSHCIMLPDGIDIDIIRNRNLVYLHDWHLDMRFEDD